jgi:lipopolysaccharide core heptose(I) kinase
MWRTDVIDMPPQMARAFGAVSKEDAFEKVMALQGDVFRDVPGRRTLRFGLPGKLPEKSLFAKLHYGVGWGEIFKNLLSLRLPILSAMTEVRAIQKLDALNIPTTPLVAYGKKGCNPAAIRSFVITEDLGDIVSLETFCADWKVNPPPLKFKRDLIKAVANLARAFHDNGMNHRDFYICHICLDSKRLAAGEIYLYLIDLHRVGIRETITSNARMKDMAALYWSALDIGLTGRDYLRFLKVYRQQPLSQTFDTELDFWEKVATRAKQLYIKFHHRPPQNLYRIGA